MNPGCGHGPTWSEPCVDCALVWSQMCLKSAQASVDLHTKEIARLTALKEQPK